VIIKSTNGNLFGNYTKQRWSGNVVYIANPNAFLFSFIYHHNTKIFIKCTKPSHAIAAYCGYWPLFGDGGDLHIGNNSNRFNGNLGSSYKHPIYGLSSNEAKPYFAGSYKFLITEHERVNS